MNEALRNFYLGVYVGHLSNLGLNVDKLYIAIKSADMDEIMRETYNLEKGADEKQKKTIKEIRQVLVIGVNPDPHELIETAERYILEDSTQK